MYRQPEIGAIFQARKTAASPQGWRLSYQCLTNLRHCRGLRISLFAFVAAVASTGLQSQSAMGQEPESKQNEVFATVNGEPIQLSTYQTTLHLSARQNFYHGQPPDEDLRVFRKQIGDRLVEELVLHQEALRLGIEPDSERVDAELNKNIKRLSVQSGWQQAKDTLIPTIREGLERHDRIRQLKEGFKQQASVPDESEIQAFYQANLDKFTSPPQTRISMIMLKVPPWGDTVMWSERREELSKIRHEINGGMEFSEAARRYSDDGSASNGGDMGYLHEGMLGTQAEAAIASMNIGDISEPTTLLEGVALFQLKERSGIQVNPLDKVRERATELLMREKRDSAVINTIERLRSKAVIRYTDPEYYELRQEANGSNETPQS